jgi:hypothetical protein
LLDEVGFDGNTSNKEVTHLAHALQVAYKALAFAEGHGFESYDPSDIKGTKIVLWTYGKSSLFPRLLRLILFGGIYLAPIGMRKLLKVKPARSPHAYAMLACAYLELSRLMSDEMWMLRAKSLLEWLKVNTAPSTVGESWSAPFLWFSYAGVVPTTAGNAHYTNWATNAFLSYYEATQDEEALEHCIRACDFLISGLNLVQRASGSQAISYTALDRSQCINVNADAASVLLRVGRAAKRPYYRETARKIIHFVLEAQLTDGSWYYDEYVPGVFRIPHIDGFHTGMVLSALAQVVPELHDDPDLKNNCAAALSRGLAFYLDNLFSPDGKPLYEVNQLYPIDPYSCGQAINTLIDAANCRALDARLRERTVAFLPQVVDQTLHLMLDQDGSFFTARYRFRIFRLKSLRWAQALLALAFVRYSRFLLSRIKGGADSIESACAELQ